LGAAMPTTTTLQSLNSFVLNGMGDWASVLGVLIALGGFGITIWNVRRTKTAAERAEQMVGRIREDVVRIDTVSDCSTAISLMEQIRGHLRDGKIERLPDKVSGLRKIFIQIRKTNTQLSPDQQRSLQSAVTDFRAIEEKVVKALADEPISLDIPRLHSTICRKADSVQEMLVEIKNSIGR